MADASDKVEAAQKELDEALAAARSHGALSSTQASSGKADAHMAEWNPELVMKLSLGVAMFAMFALVLATVLILKRRNAEQVLRTFGILVIIFAAIFLVIAGYSDTQITPVIGLLGTIAGYLLGRRIEPPTDLKSQRGQRVDDDASAPEKHHEKTK